jgi:ataxia telangiectasia mutated family protein
MLLLDSELVLISLRSKLLNDKAYHKILEDLFRVIVEEKKSLHSSKKKPTTIARLRDCADAVVSVLQVATFRLKTKSVEAVIDHITQTLPTDDGYCEPIAQHYLKSFRIVLERQANVEHLKPNTWLETVDFCLSGINKYADDNENESMGLSRSHSLGRTQPQPGSISRQNVEELLQALSNLVSAQNAPILERCDSISRSIFAFLKSRGSVSQLQRVAFSILNAVLFAAREDRSSISKSIAEEAVPIICRFWQGKSVAKDEMLNSVRDEMIILFFLSHLHVECVIKKDENNLVSKLNDLLDVVRAEYARRLERDQLQLEDLEMADLGAVATDGSPFQLNDFRLGLHNTRAERNWANLLVVGILERLVSRSSQETSPDSAQDDPSEQPRKRQRTMQSSDRLLSPLKSEDSSKRIAALQSLPFVLQQAELSASVLADVLEQLCVCVVDKRGNIASWAFIAIARLVLKYSDLC